jgi:hypothetical protein
MSMPHMPALEEVVVMTSIVSLLCCPLAALVLLASRRRGARLLPYADDFSYVPPST